MKFYGENKLLYLETDVSQIGLGAMLLQTRDGQHIRATMLPDNTAL